MEYVLISNDPDIVSLAERSGVHRIMIDLEVLGKDARQGHLNTVISRHTLSDIEKIRPIISRMSLQVRINPIHSGSKAEIDDVIRLGADDIMLPMFKSAGDVEQFISYVNGRAKTILLLETPQALVRINDILCIPGIDAVFVGLNDLHLGMGLTFMFELLSGGIIDYIASHVHSKGLCFGFGGIARLGTGIIDASLILSEHYRLRSSCVILSRSFHDYSHNALELHSRINLEHEIYALNSLWSTFQSESSETIHKRKQIFRKKVYDIVQQGVTRPA